MSCVALVLTAAGAVVAAWAGITDAMMISVSNSAVSFFIF
jgi:hypothetical protein